jgi:hypothetical protein
MLPKFSLKKLVGLAIRKIGFAANLELLTGMVFRRAREDTVNHLQHFRNSSISQTG